MNDQVLIAQSLRGDASTFEQLVKKHLSSVYAFAFQLVRDREVADDITQETFIKAWKHLARFDLEKNFKSWLFVIAKRTAIDLWKKNRRIEPFSALSDKEEYSVFEKSVESGDFPGSILEREDVAKEIEQALSLLPESARMILLLVYKEDLSLQEIAEIFDEPYNTVKSRHNRAIKRLKEAIINQNAPKSNF